LGGGGPLPLGPLGGGGPLPLSPLGGGPLPLGGSPLGGGPLPLGGPLGGPLGPWATTAATIKAKARKMIPFDILNWFLEQRKQTRFSALNKKLKIFN